MFIYLIVQNKFTEGLNVFCPLHEDEQLLLHRLPDVGNARQSLGADIVICQLHAHVVTVASLGLNNALKNLK